MSNEPKQRFTGIFIPVEILEIDEISLTEKFLLAIIDSLYCKDYGGCFASNEYLANKLNLNEEALRKHLSKLKKLTLIEQVSFDGRTRVLRSLINKFVDKKQSNADRTKSSGQSGQDQADWENLPTLDGKNRPVSPIYDSKEDNVVGEGGKEEPDKSRILQRSLKEKLDWQPAEIEIGFKALNNCEDKISDPFAYVKQVIENIRNNTQNRGNKKCNVKKPNVQETYNEKSSEKNSKVWFSPSFDALRTQLNASASGCLTPNTSC